MKHTYHVLTPLGRVHQVPRLAKALHLSDVVWHPIVEDDLCFWISGDRIDSFKFHRSPDGWHPAHYGINQFIDKGNIYEADRYMILPDDDAYGDGFWEKIDSADGDLLIWSMERPAHNDVLEAKVENIRGGGIGGEQLCMTGDLLKQSRFSPPYGGDWDFIQKICENRTPTFIPEARVIFNCHP